MKDRRARMRLASRRRPRTGRSEGVSGMELVGPQDVFFLHVETPAIPQHLIGLAFLDPTTRSGTIGLEDVIRSVEGRLPRLPRFRQRLAVPRWGLSRPAWVDATGFDIREH